MFQDGSNHQPEYDEYVYEIDISSFITFYNQANELIYDCVLPHGCKCSASFHDYIGEFWYLLLYWAPFFAVEGLNQLFYAYFHWVIINIDGMTY